MTTFTFNFENSEFRVTANGLGEAFKAANEHFKVRTATDEDGNPFDAWFDSFTPTSFTAGFVRAPVA